MAMIFGRCCSKRSSSVVFTATLLLVPTLVLSAREFSESDEAMMNPYWHSTHFSNSRFRFSDPPRSWSKSCLESPDGARRQWIDERSLQMSAAPASAPAPVPRSTTAPATAPGPGPASRLTPYPPPRHAFASAPAPTAVKEPPSHSLGPSSNLPPPMGTLAPAYHPSADAPLPSLSPNFNNSDSSISIAPAAVSAAPSGVRQMGVAVVLAGLASFFLSGVLFCCYSARRQRNGISLETNHRDERPFEVLRLGDFSDDGFHKKPDNCESNLVEVGKEKLTATEEKNSTLSSLDVKPLLQTQKPSPLTLPSPPPHPPPRPHQAMPPPIKKDNSPVPEPPPPPPKPGPLPPPLPNSSLYGQQPASIGHDNVPKSKLKPLFWEKVPTNPDQSMVWHRIASGSFRLDEEMVENLFGYRLCDNHKFDVKKGSSSSTDASSTTRLVQILDHKKSQNIAILLRALNVSRDEVHDAVVEGSKLSNEFLQALLKMAPTSEEELKLRFYSGEISHLDIAERFFKKLLDIPNVFKRLDILLFMGTLQEDIPAIKQSLATLEIACKELRSNRLFLKLLEAVLKTGNRMNNGTFRGGAQAFKLDTLLKLEDVKGIDGKTTLLHFVVQEIIRSEGMQAVQLAKKVNGSISTVEQQNDHTPESKDDFHSIGLKIVSGLTNELEEVKKAAVVDIDELTTVVKNHGDCLIKAKEFLNKDITGEDSGFYHSLKYFIEHAETNVISLLEDEKKIRALVKNTTEYFHGNSTGQKGLCLFVIVRNFLGMVDKVCAEIRKAPSKIGTETS